MPFPVLNASPFISTWRAPSRFLRGRWGGTNSQLLFSWKMFVSQFWRATWWGIEFLLGRELPFFSHPPSFFPSSLSSLLHFVSITLLFPVYQCIYWASRWRPDAICLLCNEQPSKFLTICVSIIIFGRSFGDLRNSQWTCFPWASALVCYSLGASSVVPIRIGDPACGCQLRGEEALSSGGKGGLEGDGDVWCVGKASCDPHGTL